MVNTSVRPITVDGVRLDTLAWNVTKINRQGAGRRASDNGSPLMDGELTSYPDTLETARFGLEMWVRGTDADGVVPGAGSVTRLRENLDELVHLFTKRIGLLDVQEQVDAGGTMRQARCKLADMIAPDLNAVGTVATFTVGLVIPAGMWQDPATADWSLTTTGGSIYEVTTLQGATERINDAIFLVTGPANAPFIYDHVAGYQVNLNTALAAGQQWRFNSGTWQSVTGASIGFTSTSGLTDRADVTAVSAAPTAYGLPLYPVRDTGLRRVKIGFDAGGGATGATAVAVRARRKYVL